MEVLLGEAKRSYEGVSRRRDSADGPARGSEGQTVCPSPPSYNNKYFKNTKIIIYNY